MKPNFGNVVARKLKFSSACLELYSLLTSLSVNLYAVFVCICLSDSLALGIKKLGSRNLANRITSCKTNSTFCFLYVLCYGLVSNSNLIL